MFSWLFRQRKNGLKSSVRFAGDQCFFSAAGFLGSSGHLDRIESDLNQIKENSEWRYLYADLSGLSITGPGSLPTYFLAIVMRLAGCSESRQADWSLILSDSDQAHTIDFFRRRDRKFIDEHIIYAGDKSANSQRAGNLESSKRT